MKIGDRVLLNKVSTKSSYNSLMLQCAKDEIWGIVTNASTANHIVCFFSNINYKSFNVYDCDLILIKEEDYEKYNENNKKYIKEKWPEVDALKVSFDTPTKGNYTDKDPNVEKYKYGTQFVYAIRAIINFKDGTFRNTTYGPQLDCCDFIKDTTDFIYHMPIYYLNYYQYTIWDLNKWLQFIEKCNLGFKYIVEGEVTLPTNYGTQWKNDDYSIYWDAKAIYATDKTKCIEIKVANTQKQKYHAYLYLLLIRYMQHPATYYIPMRAMQIKDTLGSEITHFEALIMAHYDKRYINAYNCLIRPEYIVEKNFKPETLLENLKTKSMFESFSYRGNNNLASYKKLLEEGKYEELLTLLKK